MIPQARLCTYCGKRFVPSAFRPEQRVCSAPACQRRRQTDYHRMKSQTDAEYSQVCAESCGKWRTRHPDYHRLYRKTHLDYAKDNLRAQKRRDRKRRMRDLVNNNLALDLKSVSADVWLVGPDLADPVNNNLAISQVMLFQAVGSEQVGAG